MGHRKIRYVSQPAARIQIHRSFGPYINANRESENCVQQFSAGQKMAGGSGRARAIRTDWRHRGPAEHYATPCTSQLDRISMVAVDSQARPTWKNRGSRQCMNRC
jgi:hypothetical protein